MTDVIKLAVADNLSISKALAVCGKRLHTLYYLKENHNFLIKKNKTEFAYDAATTAIIDTISMANFIDKKRNCILSKIWHGVINDTELDMLTPDYFNFQDSLAEKAMQELDDSLLTEKLSDIVMIYDVNERSEFVRGYLSQGKQLNIKDNDDKKVITVVDQAFHSWLVRNEMGIQNGVIYMNTPRDINGNYIERANPETISLLLIDSQKGLDATIKKHDMSFSVTVNNKKQSLLKKQPSLDAKPDESKKSSLISQNNYPINDPGSETSSLPS